MNRSASTHPALCTMLSNGTVFRGMELKFIERCLSKSHDFVFTIKGDGSAIICTFEPTSKPGSALIQ